MIWTYAVKVDRILVTTSYCWETRRHAVTRGGGVAMEGYGKIASRHLDDSWTSCCPLRELGAFHLPEVCRQVYIETATLAYSSNIFLANRDALSCKNWAREKFSLAQRDAIARVELDVCALYKQMRRIPGPLRLRGFRGLTHIHIPLHVLRMLVREYYTHYNASYDPDILKKVGAICEAKLKEIEGSHIVVVFEDDDAAEVSDAED
jgi:hypothetical protein